MWLFYCFFIHLSICTSRDNSVKKIKNLPLNNDVNFCRVLKASPLNITLDSTIGAQELSKRAISEFNKRRPNYKNNETLKAVKAIRDNFIAHASINPIDIQVVKNCSGIKLDELVKWADQFCRAIYKGYFPRIIPANVDRHSSTHIQNLEALLRYVAGKDIKTLSELKALELAFVR